MTKKPTTSKDAADKVVKRVNATTATMLREHFAQDEMLSDIGRPSEIICQMDDEVLTH